MRLGDLNEIKVRVERQYEYCHGYSGNKKTIYREALLAVRSILHSAKTIDAVPVVRCRDCKNYEIHKPKVLENCERNGYITPMKPDDFCSYGERKGGSDNEP